MFWVLINTCLSFMLHSHRKTWRTSCVLLLVGCGHRIYVFSWYLWTYKLSVCIHFVNWLNSFRLWSELRFIIRSNQTIVVWQHFAHVNLMWIRMLIFSWQLSRFENSIGCVRNNIVFEWFWILIVEITGCHCCLVMIEIAFLKM